MSDIQIKVTENKAPDPIPEGTYPAMIKTLEEKSGNFGDYVQIGFEITEGKYKETVKTAVASKKISFSKTGRNSKLYDLFKDFFKDQIAAGKTITLNDLVGKECQILVESTPADVDGNVWQNVTKVFFS